MPDEPARGSRASEPAQPAATAPAQPAAAGRQHRSRVRRPALVVGLVLVLTVALVAAAVFFRAPEPRALALDGDLGTHDPALVVGGEGQPWFVYSTGDPARGLGAPMVHRSADGLSWERVGPAWPASDDPQWVRDSIDGVEHYWAPDLIAHDGTWYLYFSASTFGSNTSAIGLATGASLDPADPDYGWTHQGPVWRSQAGETNYNAIDPAVVEDDDGHPWLFFGSFWSGIQVLPLEWPSGMPVEGAEPQLVATRTGVSENQIEAPQVIEHDGWFCLFYIGYEDMFKARICLARSRDGVTGWERHPENPILSPGLPGAWDSEAAYKPFVVYDADEDQWLMWFNARTSTTERIGLAVHPGSDLWKERSFG